MSGHRGDVTTLSFDHSGKYLFSGARDNTIMLWSVEKRNRVRQIHDARGAAGTSTHAGDISRIRIVRGGGGNQVYSLSSSLDSNVIVMSLGDDVAKAHSTDEETKEEDGTETKEEDKSRNKVDVISLLTEDDTLTDSTTIGSKDISDTVLYRQFVHDDEGVSKMEYNRKLNIVATASPMNRVTIWHVKDIFSDSSSSSDVSSKTNVVGASRNPILDLTQTFVGHNKKVTSIEMLSESGSHIVSASDDYSVNVYVQVGCCSSASLCCNFHTFTHNSCTRQKKKS